MKNLRTFFACLCMTVSVCSFAQNDNVPLNEPNPNKPKLFAALPESLPANIGGLVDLLSLETGATVNIPISSVFRIQGQVVSTATKYENTMRSIVIRSTNYVGARFSFTRTVNPDGTEVFSGLIMSMDHGDLFELQNQNGQYSFVKKKFYDLINE